MSLMHACAETKGNQSALRKLHTVTLYIRKVGSKLYITDFRVALRYQPKEPTLNQQLTPDLLVTAGTTFQHCS